MTWKMQSGYPVRVSMEARSKLPSRVDKALVVHGGIGSGRYWAKRGGEARRGKKKGGRVLFPNDTLTPSCMLCVFNFFRKDSNVAILQSCQQQQGGVLALQVKVVPS